MAAVKIMYVAPRPAGMTAAAFAARWRRHASLAIGDDEWRAAASWYEFFDPVGSAEALRLAGGREGFEPAADLGGVCIVRFADPGALERRLADPAFAELLFEDELITFGRRLDHDLFAVDELVLRDAAPPALTLIGISHRRPGLGAEEFAGLWEEAGRELLAASPGPSRLRLNLMPPEAPYEGIYELGFGAAADLASFLRAAPPGDDLRTALDAPLDRARSARFLARSEVLHS